MCGQVGHKARDSEKRINKLSDKASAMVTQSIDDDWDTVYVARATEEKAYHSKFDILLDNEASLNIFGNKKLLKNIIRSKRQITITGVEANTTGVIVNLEGTFSDVGQVYYSDKANANILSFATQIDNGARIVYDDTNDVFIMQPKNSKSVYTFGRKQTTGSDGRLYSCGVRTMINYGEEAMISTGAENIKQYINREIAAAKAARKLLARMFFPSVGDEKHLVTTGSGFEVSARNFDRANAIYGNDIASIKGKSTKPVSAIADPSEARTAEPQAHALHIDIMFVEGLPFLIGVALPLDLTLVYELKNFDGDKTSRSAPVVQLGLESFRSALRSNGFSVGFGKTDAAAHYRKDRSRRVWGG